MVSFLRIFVLLAIILLAGFSCTTTDGDIINPPVTSYSLWVKSGGADGARIFLDHKDTGLKTPALVENISDDLHVFHVFASNYRNSPDSIIVSDFGNLDSIAFDLTPQTGGDLIIRSEPDSARVFINSLEFGLTPLTVAGLQAGQHRVKLLKSNYDAVYRDVTVAASDSVNLVVQLSEDLRNFVLLEHFSNSGCTPCVPVDALVDQLAAEYPTNQLILLGYHASSPDPADPMYNASSAIVDARFNYYNAIFTPRSYVGGELVSNPRDSAQYHTKIRQQLAADTVATIAFQQVNRGQSSLSGVLQVEALAQLPADGKLHILLIEDDIHFSSAPGINGLTHFAYVARDFAASVNGQDCIMQAGEKKIFNFDFIEINRWGSDLTVVAFLQAASTKKIIQAGWTKYPEFK